MPRVYTYNQLFEPMTFEQRLAPLKMIWDAQDKLDDELSKIGENAADIQGIIGNDPEYNTKIASFNSDLSAARDAIYDGDAQSARRALNNLRNRFKTEIVPLGEAAKARAENIKMDRKLKSQNPDLIGIDPNTRSSSEYLNGNIPDAGYIDTSKVQKKVEDEVSKLAQATFSDPTIKTALGSQYWDFQTENGYTPQMLDLVLSGDYENFEPKTEAEQKLYDNMKSFKALYDREYDNSRLQGYDDASKKKYQDAIDRAFYAGLRDPKHDYKANRGYLEPDRNEWMYEHDPNGRRIGYSPDYIKSYQDLHTRRTGGQGDGHPQLVQRQNSTEIEVKYNKDGSVKKTTIKASIKPTTVQDRDKLNSNISMYDIHDVPIQKEILNHAGISVENLTDSEISQKYDNFLPQLASTYTLVGKRNNKGKIEKLRIDAASSEKEKDVAGYEGREIQETEDVSVPSVQNVSSETQKPAPVPVNYTD